MTSITGSAFQGKTHRRVNIIIPRVSIIILRTKEFMEEIQRRRTRKEMFPIVEAWHHSGLSKKAFCKEQGIVKSVFLYWCKKYREENESGGFITLDPSIPHAVSKSFSIEIQYPNGILLRLPANTPANLVRQYIVQ